MRTIFELAVENVWNMLRKDEYIGLNPEANWIDKDDILGGLDAGVVETMQDMPFVILATIVQDCGKTNDATEEETLRDSLWRVVYREMMNALYKRVVEYIAQHK